MRGAPRHAPWMDKVTHLVSSHMQRALNSCLLTSEPVASRGKRIVALPALTDTGTHEASFGSSKSVFAAAFGDKVDLGWLPVGWDAPEPEGRFAARRRSDSSTAQRWAAHQSGSSTVRRWRDGRKMLCEGATPRILRRMSEIDATFQAAAQEKPRITTMPDSGRVRDGVGGVGGGPE
ncbi:hypothetical protein DL771_003872 [Monosporascus sp. 5C6A]|nr:hypothetical protein DL771_003872 [Monosporascus sp. 5C6A]